MAQLTRTDTLALPEEVLDFNCCDECCAKLQEPCTKFYRERCPEVLANLEAYPVSVEESGSQFVPSDSWPWIRGVFAVLGIIFLIWDIARWISTGIGQFWFIKLTHWTYLVSIVYLCLGFAETIILYKAFVDNGRIMTTKELDLVGLARSARVFLNVAGAANLVVIFLFWTLLFKWDTYKDDPQSFIITLYKHGVNGVIVVMDAFIGAAWMRHKDFGWPLGFGIAWTLWSVIHWAAGWKNESGCNCIYSVLNWNNPGTTLPITIAAIIFFMIMHFVLVFLVNFTRNKCHTDRVWDNLPIDVPDDLQVNVELQIQG